MADYIVEHLKFETEVLKLTALVTLAIGGGTVSLLLGDLTPRRIFFAGSGFLVTLGAFVALWRQRRALRNDIAAIPKDAL